MSDSYEKIFSPDSEGIPEGESPKKTAVDYDSLIGEIDEYFKTRDKKLSEEKTELPSFSGTKAFEGDFSSAVDTAIKNTSSQEYDFSGKSGFDFSSIAGDIKPVAQEEKSQEPNFNIAIDWSAESLNEDIVSPKAVTPPEEQYAPSKGEKNYRMQEKRKNKFRREFRVLSEGAGDTVILEEEKQSKGSLADNLSLRENEDIFEAAERSQKKKKKGGIFSAEGKSAESLKKRAKEKKAEEVIAGVKSLSEKLSKKNKLQKLQLIFLGIFLAMSVVLYALPHFYAVSNPLEPIFAEGGRLYGIINIALLVLIALAGCDRFWSGIKSFRHMEFTGNTGLVILFIFVLAHDGYTMYKGACGLGGNELYTLYAAFAFLVSVLSEKLRNDICLGNLSVVSQGTVVDSINSVRDRADSQVLAKGIFGGEERLLYCAGAETVRNLREDMGMRREEKSFYPASYMGVLLASVICGIILALRGGLSFLVTGLVACICLCAPTVCEFSRIFLLYLKNKELNSQGGAVLDFKGTEQMGKAKGIVMDVSDIFTVEIFKCCKVQNARIDSVKLSELTAAILKQSGSMLYTSFFAQVEKNSSSGLPTAEDFEYIPRQGFKGTYNRRRVLVGNRELLKSNKIEPPSKKAEDTHAQGKSLYYIAVDDEICAYFLASYEVRASIKRASASFGKTGLVLFLSSKEPNLGENLVAEKMRIDVHSVKFLSHDGGNLMQEYKQNKSMRALSSLVCARKKKFIFNLAVWAQRFYDADRFVFGMNIVGQLLFFFLLVAAVFMNIGVIFSPVVIILLHCLWSILSVFFGHIKK